MLLTCRKSRIKDWRVETLACQATIGRRLAYRLLSTGAAGFCRRGAVVLENGRSALAGSAAALRARDDVQALYLGGAARPASDRSPGSRVPAPA
jgi:hypothetical protein